MKSCGLLLIAFFYLGVGASNAQYKIITTFGINGAEPPGSLLLSKNTFYGVTGGFADGTVFSEDTTGYGGENAILTFNKANGAGPEGTPILSGNRLYGMTINGGAHDSGCIFSVDTNGNGYKDLFDFNGTNGSNPDGSLTLFGSQLFGMTFDGGINESGNIFALDTNGLYYKDLFDFNGTNGAEQYGSVMAAGSKLYGMTKEGGNKGEGVIFKVDTNSVSTAGINQIEFPLNTIDLYPNPNNGDFVISLKGITVMTHIEVYDILGQNIYQNILSPATTHIKMGSQPAGIYLYRVITEDGKYNVSGTFIIH